MAQINKATPLVEVLSVMVPALSISVMDGQKSTALRQTISLDDPGDPEAAVFEGQSEGAVSTLDKLLEEAQTHLDAARGNETAGIQSFETPKESEVRGHFCSGHSWVSRFPVYHALLQSVRAFYSSCQITASKARWLSLDHKCVSRRLTMWLI